MPVVASSPATYVAWVTRTQSASIESKVVLANDKASLMLRLLLYLRTCYAHTAVATSPSNLINLF